MLLKIRKIKKVKIIAIVSIVVVASMIFIGCGNNQEAIDKAVEEALRAAGVYDIENNETTTTQNIIPKSTADSTTENAENAVLDENISSNDSSDAFDAELIAQSLSAQIYSYTDMFSYYTALVIENTSNFNLDISATLQTFDSSGNLLSSKSKSESAIPSKMKTVLIFSLDEDFADSSYEFEVKQTKYECITQNLTFTSNSAKNKEVLSITNNGDVVGRFVEAYMLFFNGNKLVDHSSKYFTDNDSELKTGKTISAELSCYEDYDGFMVFFTGYGK